MIAARLTNRLRFIVICPFPVAIGRHCVARHQAWPSIPRLADVTASLLVLSFPQMGDNLGETREDVDLTQVREGGKDIREIKWRK